MTLEIIGAGFGRTGTLSLKTALEQLGFERCYHMYEVLSNLEHAEQWVAADRGEAVDFGDLFAGYRATVDWPACVFWRELMGAFPDAKVLLSVRPPDRWYASFADTIYEVLVREVPAAVRDVPAFDTLNTMSQRVVNLRSFGADLRQLGRDEIIAAYERHNASVREGVPADRLLEFDVAEGWEPLCAFLGVAVPHEPFPNVNDRAMFRQLFMLDEGLDGDAAAAATPADLEDRFRPSAGG